MLLLCGFDNVYSCAFQCLSKMDHSVHFQDISEVPGVLPTEPHVSAAPLHATVTPVTSDTAKCLLRLSTWVTVDCLAAGGNQLAVHTRTLCGATLLCWCGLYFHSYFTVLITVIWKLKSGNACVPALPCFSQSSFLVIASAIYTYFRISFQHKYKSLLEFL